MSFDPVLPSDLFQCKKCGECCKGYGGTYVTRADIRAISEFLGEDPETFVEKYCQMSGKRPVLAQGPDGFCVFWDKLCTIHPVKPAMCKAWPFIKPVLKDISNWEIMSQFCPGIRTDLPKQVIHRVVKEKLQKCQSSGDDLDRNL